MISKEVRPPVEIEKQSQLFELDSLSVIFKSDSKDAIELCHSYFDLYSKPGQNQDNEQWTVIDTIDEFADSTICDIDKDSKIITICRNSVDFKMGMRVIRSLMMYEDIVSGKVMFKGASFINENGKGIVLMGEKGSGKTSIILDSLLRPEQNSTFVTNSQVSIKLKDGKPCAYGYPMAMGVRMDALKAMSENSSPHVLPFFKDLISKGFFAEDGRYHMDPANLAKYFEQRIKGDIRADAIVFITNVSEGETASLDEVLSEDFHDFFEYYFLEHYNSDEVGWYKTLGMDPIDQSSLVKEIINNSKVYVLSYPFGHLQEAIPLLDEL